MADQALRNSSDSLPPVSVQSQLSLLAGKLSDAVMLMDKEFRILYANPRALEISQITAANFNRETLWELNPGVLESPLGHTSSPGNMAPGFRPRHARRITALQVNL